MIFWRASRILAFTGSALITRTSKCLLSKLNWIFNNVTLYIKQFNLLVFLWGRIHWLSMSNRLERVLERTLQTRGHLRWWYRTISLSLPARFYGWICFISLKIKSMHLNELNLKATTAKSISTNVNRILARTEQRAKMGTTDTVAAVCPAMKGLFAKWTLPFVDINNITMTRAVAIFFCRPPAVTEPVASKAPV